MSSNYTVFVHLDAIQGTPLFQMSLRTALCRRQPLDSKVISSFVPSCSVQSVTVSVNILSRSCSRSYTIHQNVCHHSATTTVTCSAQRPFQYWFPNGICALTFSTFSPSCDRRFCLFPHAFAGGALWLSLPPVQPFVCRPLFDPTWPHQVTVSSSVEISCVIFRSATTKY